MSAPGPSTSKLRKRSVKGNIKREPSDEECCDLDETVPKMSVKGATVKKEKRKVEEDGETLQPKKRSKHQSDGDTPQLNIPALLSQQHHIDLDVSFNISHLLEEDHKVSFIARYRKAQTRDIDPEVLHEVAASHTYLQSLQQAVTKAYTQLKREEKATPEICRALVSVSKKSHLETLMEPHKKAAKTTLASRARAAGLETAALELLRGTARCQPTMLIQPGVEGRSSVQEIQAGINHIICDVIMKNVDVQREIVSMASHPGIQLETKPKVTKSSSTVSKSSSTVSKSSSTVSKSSSTVSKRAEDESYRYRNYLNYRKPVKYVRSYEYLAICRAEDHKYITVKLNVPDQLRHSFTAFCMKKTLSSGHVDDYRTSVVSQCVADVYSKNVMRQLEKQVRGSLKETAEHQAMLVMSRNLKAKLLTPPIRGRTILALDPGFRACKFAAVSPQGEILETGVIHPRLETYNMAATADPAAGRLRDLVKGHNVTLVCIGNGTACRETWRYVAVLNGDGWLSDPPLDVTLVDEGGASEYSTTKMAAAEMPELDCTVRSAVSLARRLQDPLSELVKIDVTCLGVGMYQKDMPASQVREALGEVVSGCVGTVGVDVNTASVELLKKVPGLNAASADAIVKKRAAHLFANREQLKAVKGIGPKRFEQAAGFVKILPETGPGSKGEKFTPKKGSSASASAASTELDPLDRTIVHPESYPVAHRLLKMVGCESDAVGSPELIQRLNDQLISTPRQQLADSLQTDIHTLGLILQAFSQPGYDERQERAAPMFWKAAMQSEDVRLGVRLKGVVRNPTEFGAFVDLGIGEAGLIHTSQMGSVAELRVNDHVLVEVCKVEPKRSKVDIGLRLVSKLDGRLPEENPPLAITAG